MMVGALHFLLSMVGGPNLVRASVRRCASLPALSKGALHFSRAPLTMAASRAAPHAELLPPSGKPLWRVNIDNGVDARAWDVVCDARSPSEFHEDHIPGATNCAVLTDDERVEVGTLHAKSAFEARRRGAALVARNLHAILSSPTFAELDSDARILVYCARGGERSRSLAYVLSRVGWSVGIVDGGYKSYRALVRSALSRLGDFEYHVISGPTGSAKGKLLLMLEREGAQVIDLEELANHKGSALGANPSSAQPSQKQFESRLMQASLVFARERLVFVESESSLVGTLHVPPEMFHKMQRAEKTTVLSLPMAERVAWIRAGYSHFETTHVPELKRALAKLTRLRGAERVSAWGALADAGLWDDLVQSLLEHHYDPAYAKSKDRIAGDAASDGRECVGGGGQGQVLELPDTSDRSYLEAARNLLARGGQYSARL